MKNTSKTRDTGALETHVGPQKKHDALVGHLSTFYGSKLESKGYKFLTDYDILKNSYRFLRSEDDDMESLAKEAPSVVRMARNYYDRLFKEYALCDLSRVSKKNKAIGLRWRTHKECVQGKGQFSCGALGCDSVDGLESYEVPFKYKESAENKHALVKVRVCRECSLLLVSSGNARVVSSSKGGRKKKRRREDSSEQTERKQTSSNHDTNISSYDEDLFL